MDAQIYAIIGQAIPHLLGFFAGVDKFGAAQFGKLLAERRLRDLGYLADFCHRAFPAQKAA